jgi:hypothetical protein
MTDLASELPKASTWGRGTNGSSASTPKMSITKNKTKQNKKTQSCGGSRAKTATETELWQEERHSCLC